MKCFGEDRCHTYTPVFSQKICFENKKNKKINESNYNLLTDWSFSTKHRNTTSSRIRRTAIWSGCSPEMQIFRLKFMEFSNLDKINNCWKLTSFEYISLKCVFYAILDTWTKKWHKPPHKQQHMTCERATFLITFLGNSISQMHKKTRPISFPFISVASIGHFYLLFALSILYSNVPVICSKSCAVKSSQCVEINPEQYSSRLCAPTSSATQ